jgi:Flp pilus assembly protein TadD
MLAQSLTRLSRCEEALTALRSAQAIAGPRPIILAELAYVSSRLGQVEEARQLLRQLTDLAGREHVPLYYLALAHMSAGEEATALDLMETAYEQRSTLMPFIGTNGHLASLHHHPRFVRLLERLDLPNQVGTA